MPNFMLNIYLKSNWLIILFSNSAPLSVCRAIGTLKVEIKFWMYQVLFCRFILQQDYSSIFNKMIYHCKKTFEPIWRFMLDNVKHFSQNRNYGSKYIFCLFHSLIRTYFSSLSLIKMSDWTFLHSLRFALVFILGAINYVNLRINDIYSHV